LPAAVSGGCNGAPALASFDGLDAAMINRHRQPSLMAIDLKRTSCRVRFSAENVAWYEVSQEIWRVECSRFLYLNYLLSFLLNILQILLYLQL
jgi:hypothetical protein